MYINLFFDSSNRSLKSRCLQNHTLSKDAKETFILLPFGDCWSSFAFHMTCDCLPSACIICSPPMTPCAPYLLLWSRHCFKIQSKSRSVLFDNFSLITSENTYFQKIIFTDRGVRGWAPSFGGHTSIYYTKDQSYSNNMSSHWKFESRKLLI